MDLNMGTVYFDFHIDTLGYALVFSSKNTIHFFKAGTYFELDFIRKLPLFKYDNEVRFALNENFTQLVFKRKAEFLFILMQGMWVHNDKYLFVYDLSQVSHNCLIAVRQVDTHYSHLDNYMYVDALDQSNNTFIYLFFEGNRFQYFNFEPRNYIMKDPKEEGHMFLPSNIEDAKPYDSHNFTLAIYPLAVRRTSPADSQTVTNTSIKLDIEVENLGLLINNRMGQTKIYLLDESDSYNLQLLDIFDGFNNSYSIVDEENNWNEDFLKLELSNDYVEEYIIDSVSSSNSISHGLLYEAYTYAFLLLFYSQEDLLQLYDLTNGIDKYIDNLNYTEIFD